MVDAVVGAEPDRPGRGVYRHGHQGPEHQVYLGHHQHIQHVVDLVGEVEVLVLVVAGVLHPLQVVEGVGQNCQDLQQQRPHHALVPHQLAEDALAGVPLGHFGVNAVLVNLQLQLYDLAEDHQQHQHAGGAANDGHEGGGHPARGEQIVRFYFYHPQKYSQQG